MTELVYLVTSTLTHEADPKKDSYVHNFSHASSMVPGKSVFKLVSQSVSQSTTLAQTGKGIHGPQRMNPHNIGLQFVQNLYQ